MCDMKYEVCFWKVELDVLQRWYINLSITCQFVVCCMALRVFDPRCWPVDSTSKSTFVHSALQDELVDLDFLVCLVTQQEIEFPFNSL